MSAMKDIRLVVVALATVASAFSAFAEEAAQQPATEKKAETAVQADGKTYKPLAEARAKIDQVIAEPAKMTEIMKELSPEDQKAFVADVNAAIEKLPGSMEDKTAKFLNVNKAALKGAAEGNMANVLAATFASVPPESLTVISERYANDLFSRDTAAAKQVSDPVYEKTAQEVVGKVEQATTGSDDAGVRNTLAILMFVRADKGQIDGLSDRLVETIPDSTTRELAKKEWIPQATEEGEQKSYDAMLAYADAGKAPNIDVVMSLAGPQILEAAMVDTTSGMNDNMGLQTQPVLEQAFGGFDEARVNAVELQDTKSAAATVNGGSEVPRTSNPVAPWNPEYQRGDIQATPETIDAIIEVEKSQQSGGGTTPEPEPEPQPYPYTSL